MPSSGFPPSSPLVEYGQLDRLAEWRESLRIPANSAFLDGTLRQTVYALLLNRSAERQVLTSVTLWELTTFIDALVSFDRLYGIANPDIDVARFDRLLGAEVVSVIPGSARPGCAPGHAR
jgi:hypothetical protein